MLLFGYVYFFCNVTRGELMKTYSYSCPVSIGATTYATRHLNLYFVIVSLPRLPSSRNRLSSLSHLAEAP